MARAPKLSQPANDAQPAETRDFVVTDPVTMDNADYLPGDTIHIDKTRHTELRTAGVVGDDWDVA